jgi:hypothetical protein
MSRFDWFPLSLSQFFPFKSNASGTGDKKVTFHYEFFDLKSQQLAPMGTFKFIENQFLFVSTEEVSPNPQ